MIANATYHHNRTVNDVAWGAFVVGAVLLIAFGVRALVQSRRRGAS